MQGDFDFYHTYVSSLAGLLPQEWAGDGSWPEVCLCPPFVYLPWLNHLLTAHVASHVALGAQDCSRASEGPVTGEISALMLADVGCAYVIVGHSERRQRGPETDAVVAEKCTNALGAGLCPIVCVGESGSVRQEGGAEAFVATQVTTLLNTLAPDSPLVIAYEPVWSIGTNLIPSLEDIQRMHQVIKRCALEKGRGDMRVLYGGSVTATTAALLAQVPDVDGALVGRACLDAPHFSEIVKAMAG